MSNRIIVATFDNTNSAYDTVSAVKKLMDEDKTEFEPKAGVLVTKDAKGNVSLLESEVNPPWGTVVGTATGALIGLIGGAPGAALGAAIGATAGVSGDSVMAALESDFVDSVTRAMNPGSTSLIVEADEMSTTTIDEVVKRNGGRVYRQEAH